MAGTVEIAVAGVALAPTPFSIDATAGLATLASAPATGRPVKAGFQFDTLVRFDADRIDVTLENFAAARLVAL